VPASPSVPTHLDLISYFRAIPDARMRRGVRISAWYQLLVAVLGNLSRCQSRRDLERFAIRHHSVLSEALGLELLGPPSDSAFRYFFRQVEVAACALRSVTGRSPRSLVVRRISISWSATARH